MDAHISVYITSAPAREFSSDDISMTAPVFSAASFVRLMTSGSTCSASSLGPYAAKTHSHLCAPLHPCVRHIISHVAAENYFYLRKRLRYVFFYSHHIRQYLGGMIHIREPVPYGNACVFSQVFNYALIVASVFYSVKNRPSTLAVSSKDSFYPSENSCCQEKSHFRLPGSRQLQRRTESWSTSFQIKKTDVFPFNI